MNEMKYSEKWQRNLRQRSNNDNNNMKNSGFCLNSTHLKRSGTIIQAKKTCQALTKKNGVHSTIVMLSAGFDYTGKGDTAVCFTCKLKVSDWTADVHPFTIHLQRSPECKFVRSLLSDEIVSVERENKFLSNKSALTGNQKLFKHQNIEREQINYLPKLVEVDAVKQVRKRTFSAWPHELSLLRAQMIEAGFFSCNVSDRVICLYCNIICQQWTPYTDDPWEIHRTSSPQCPYVLAVLDPQQQSSIRIINDQRTSDDSTQTTNINTFRCSDIVYTDTAPCHVDYMEVPRRHASFSTWPNENVPSQDDLVKAGFFYTGIKGIVTCFYCNGSLQNWGANDKPMIEHARWFPHCAYAKQLCGAELYRKIQKFKKLRSG